MKVLIIAVLFISISFCCASKMNYKNYHVYRVLISQEKQLNALKNIEAMNDGDIFMDSPVKLDQVLDVVVPPKKLGFFYYMIQNHDIQFEIISRDLQKIIDNEGLSTNRNDWMEWTTYHRYEIIYGWLDTLVEKYPGIVSQFDVGNSYEGRIIKGLKISYKSGNPGVFIESNIHAREWITSATATWIINELLTSNNSNVRDIAENIDWYIVPIVNIDGFVYTHTTNRLWRKTRKPSSNTCFGVDPNRNFGYYWSTGGESHNPCSETYAGPNALSEPEVHDFISTYKSLSKNITAYIDFHSYSQYLMYPYGTEATGPIENEADHIYIGKAMQQTISERHGTEYTFGNVTHTMYVASGCSVDHIKGVFNTPLVLMYEFRDKGETGFLLPGNQIIPNSEEVLDSLIEMVKKGREIGYFVRNSS